MLKWLNKLLGSKPEKEMSDVTMKWCKNVTNALVELNDRVKELELLKEKK